jgi:hypothetical protein
VFAACVVPIYSWSIVAFLERMPGWLLFLNSWDLIGAFAYTQAFAFLESTIVLLILIVLSVILPARFFRHRFVAQGSMTMFLTLVWAIALRNLKGKAGVVSWTLKAFFLWLVLYSTSIGASYMFIHRFKRLEESINAFIERLTVLLYVYVPITFLSLMIVILRNV